MANTQDKADKASGYALSFATNNVAGVLSVERIDGEFLKNIPLVNKDRYTGKHEYAVLGDDFQGGVLSVETILACNPKNIVVRVGPKEVPTAQERLNGIRSVLENKKSHLTCSKSNLIGFRIRKKHWIRYLKFIQIRIL